MTHTIQHTARHHFYTGTNGCLSIHTEKRLKEGDILTIVNRSVIVLKIKQNADSSTYPGLQFYDLTFKDVQ